MTSVLKYQQFMVLGLIYMLLFQYISSVHIGTKLATKRRVTKVLFTTHCTILSRQSRPTISDIQNWVIIEVSLMLLDVYTVIYWIYSSKIQSFY